MPKDKQPENHGNKPPIQRKTGKSLYEELQSLLQQRAPEGVNFRDTYGLANDDDKGNKRSR